MYRVQQIVAAPAIALAVALYDDGKMVDLGTLSGCCSGAFKINASGDVIGGLAAIPNGNESAFVHTGGKMYDLKTLFTSGLHPDVVRLTAIDINDRGQILVRGIMADGSQGHTYILQRLLP
jgi:probable HAF family extracellular repeat protein